MTSTASSESGDVDMQERGIHWTVAAVFIVGDMAGVGMVAMPSAFVNAGIVGGAVIVVIASICSGYMGVLLGENWLMLRERWTEYHHHCRDPYPEMGYRAFGPRGRTITEVLLVIQQFSITVVSLILAAANSSALLNQLFGIKLHFCFTIIIIGLIVLPMTMPGSPKDFWQIAVIAAASTTTAVILLIVGMGIDTSVCHSVVDYPDIRFDRFALAYGAIMFAYGGHSVFPTIQHDMKHPQQFMKSVILSYIVIFFMYMPVSVFGYLIYGGSLQDSIVRSVQTGWIQTMVNIMLTLHVTFTMVILINPLSLSAEHIANIPKKFGIKRVIIRSTIMLIIVFAGLTFPNFGVFVDVVGGTSTTSMSMILPGVVFVYLSAIKNKRKLLGKQRPTTISWPVLDLSEKYTPECQEKPVEEDTDVASFQDVLQYNSKPVLISISAVIVIGVLGGLASTVTAIGIMVNTHIPPPCYVQLFQGLLFVRDSGGVTYCCGPTRDVVSIAGQNATGFCTI